MKLNYLYGFFSLSFAEPAYCFGSDVWFGKIYAQMCEQSERTYGNTIGTSAMRFLYPRGGQKRRLKRVDTKNHYAANVEFAYGERIKMYAWRGQVYSV